METLVEYLNMVFQKVPMTEETNQLKSDLEISMLEKYQGLVDEGKNENEAIGIVISEFGSVDELLQEFEIKERNMENETVKETERKQVLEDEYYFDLVNNHRNFALSIATGVGIPIASIGVFMYFDSFGTGNIGLGLMLIFVSLGVSILVRAGMSHKQQEKIKLDEIMFSQNQEEDLRQMKPEIERSKIANIALGILLIIVSPAPVMMNVTDFEWLIMFIFLGLGVAVIIYYSLYTTRMNILIRKAINDKRSLG